MIGIGSTKPVLIGMICRRGITGVKDFTENHQGQDIGTMDITGKSLMAEASIPDHIMGSKF